MSNAVVEDNYQISLNCMSPTMMDRLLWLNYRERKKMWWARFHWQTVCPIRLNSQHALPILFKCTAAYEAAIAIGFSASCLNLLSGQFVISDTVTECGRWGGSEFAPAVPSSLAGQGDRSPVRCHHRVCVCLESLVAMTTTSRQRGLGVWVCGWMAGCYDHVWIFLHICHLYCISLPHVSLICVSVCVCLRLCLPDPASAGAWRGPRCDARQGVELWYHLTGEREDHRAGVQEPAVLSAA